MASLANDPGGLRRIQFTDGDGKRKTVRLGKIPKRQAERIVGHVEWLVASQIDGTAPPEETTRWLAGVKEPLRGRLERVGLAQPAEQPEEALTIGKAIEQFKDRPKWRALKPNSVRGYNYGLDRLVAEFGANTPVADVSETMAEDWHGKLMEPKPEGGGLSRASANKAADVASMLFRYAMKCREIDRNPFEEVKRGIVATDHHAFVSPEVAQTIMDDQHDTQWRLVFALARWGGLRTPSEPQELRWGDVDWERSRLTVRSPKTEHHAGRATRVIPIFPELAGPLAERFEEAEPGEEFVLPMLRGLGASAVRHHFDRAVRRLGIERWPRLMHNLRSTRQTELEQDYPTHVVCAWLGNTERIAQKHYLQVTNAHFDQAAQKAAQPATDTTGHTGNAKESDPTFPVVSQCVPVSAAQSVKRLVGE